MELKFKVHHATVQKRSKEIEIDGKKVIADIPTHVVHFVAVNHSPTGGSLKIEYVDGDIFNDGQIVILDIKPIEE